MWSLISCMRVRFYYEAKEIVETTETPPGPQNGSQTTWEARCYSVTTVVVLMVYDMNNSFSCLSVIHTVYYRKKQDNELTFMKMIKKLK